MVHTWYDSWFERDFRESLRLCHFSRLLRSQDYVEHLSIILALRKEVISTISKLVVSSFLLWHMPEKILFDIGKKYLYVTTFTFSLIGIVLFFFSLSEDFGQVLHYVLTKGTELYFTEISLAENLKEFIQTPQSQGLYYLLQSDGSIYFTSLCLN